jgi:hypothetical protein
VIHNQQPHLLLANAVGYLTSCTGQSWPVGQCHEQLHQLAVTGQLLLQPSKLSAMLNRPAIALNG